MSKGLVTRQYLEDIADAIRNLFGTYDEYTPAEMAPAILALKDREEKRFGLGLDDFLPSIQGKTITPSGTSEYLNIDFSGFETIENSACLSSFSGRRIGSLLTPNITTVKQSGLQSAFKDSKFNPNSACAFNFPALTSVGNYAFSEFAEASSAGSCSFSATGLTNVSGNYAFNQAFKDSTLSSADFSGVESVSGNYAFNEAFSGVTSSTIDFSSLRDVTGSHAFDKAFQNNSALTQLEFPDITEISASYAFSEAAVGCSNLTEISFPNLETVSGSYALNKIGMNCSNLTTASFPSLTSITGSNAFYQAFAECTSLTSIDLSGITVLNTSSALAQAFIGCTNLTSVDFSGVELIDNRNIFSDTFVRCTSLKTITFPSLKRIGDPTRRDSSNSAQLGTMTPGSMGGDASVYFPELEEIYCYGTSSQNGALWDNRGTKKFYFPKLHIISAPAGVTGSYGNAARNIFYNCNYLTEIHFGAAYQSEIEATSGFSTLWGRGAGKATVYFDL